MYTESELFALKLNRSFLEKVVVRHNLTYLENGSHSNNVCFANSLELRPEFRLVFTKTDIIHYIKACLKKDCFEIETDTLPFPQDGKIFWETVKSAYQ